MVIWTDCDREGEDIGAEIVSVCQEVKPNIDVFRARFSEITQSAIWRAVNTLSRLDQRLVDAVECRFVESLLHKFYIVSFGNFMISFLKVVQRNFNSAVQFYYSSSFLFHFLNVDQSLIFALEPLLVDCRLYT